jgi:hypothetical protein
MSLYQTRVLAYVDILGWSDACATETPRIAEAAEIIHSAAGENSRYRKAELERTYPGRVNPMFLAVEFGAFSDNFVVSKPADFGTRIFAVADVCRRLLRLGFLTRGGVTAGPVYHSDNVVFGPALIEAVALEKEAIFPRILCSNGLLRHLESLDHMTGLNPIVTDHLGRKVVNLFDPGIRAAEISEIELLGEDWELGTVQRLIAGECEKYVASGDNKRMEKWRYMQHVMKLMLDAVAIPRANLAR